ncbi:MAG: LPXTG cell wall anchor domain-containing protein [Actinomycetes bacterium]
MAVSRKVRAARWGGALLVALTPLPWLGLGSAQAADTVTYATVTGHESFSSDANHPDYWGDNCEKIVDGGNLTSYVLTQDYDLVVVKSASKNVDPYTNTLFADASSGETVWADTNGNGTFDPGGKNGDKAISHIIVCGPGETESPSPSPITSISTSKSASPSTSISTSRSASPSTSLSSSGGASPSSSISTNHSGKPQDSSSPAAITESSGAAALPHTGSDTPVAGAIGISLLLMGLGVLLLLGPGRLMPAGYHRKH